MLKRLNWPHYIRRKKTDCQGSNAWIYSTKIWHKGKEATTFQKLEPIYLTTPWNSTNFRVHLSMDSKDIIAFIEGVQKTYFCRQKNRIFLTSNDKINQKINSVHIIFWQYEWLH